MTVTIHLDAHYVQNNLYIKSYTYLQTSIYTLRDFSAVSVLMQSELEMQPNVPRCHNMKFAALVRLVVFVLLQ